VKVDLAAARERARALRPNPSPLDEAVRELGEVSPLDRRALRRMLTTFAKGPTADASAWGRLLSLFTAAIAAADEGAAPRVPAKLPGFEAPIADILRSPAKLETLRNLLLLVGYDVSEPDLRARTPRERAHAELYAQRAHLRASDNVVRVPPIPPWLKGHEHEPHGSGDPVEDAARGTR
jgi:hypothetical protein